MSPLSSTLKFITIVGARPQFIKVAAVRRAIDAHNASQHPIKVQDILIHTGQHYDDNMSEIFFQELGLPAPNYQFNSGGLSHGAMTGRMLEQIERVLMDQKPHWVLVYGDTNSTLAGALAAAKLSISLAHVEAGLRSFNRRMPEEINRIVADHCADLLFTTHASATQQLLKEGISQDKIVEVGDVMCDIAKRYRKETSQGDYVLVTVHRASNTDDPVRLQEIMLALTVIAEQVPVIFPVHPRTRHALQRLPSGEPKHPKLRLIEPVGYLEMLELESAARLIITDSGGVQKEAYFCHVPSLILRRETEWTELVDHGYAQLVDGHSDSIVEAFKTMSRRTHEWNTAFYGNGNSSHNIVQTLVNLTCLGVNSFQLKGPNRAD